MALKAPSQVNQKTLEMLDAMRALLAARGVDGVACPADGAALKFTRHQMIRLLRLMRMFGECKFVEVPGAGHNAGRWVKTGEPVRLQVLTRKPAPPSDEDGIERILPIRRRHCAAADVAPMGKPGPASVFEWASRG